MLYWKVQFEKCTRPLHFCAGINTICYHLKSKVLILSFWKEKKKKSLLTQTSSQCD